MEEVDKKKKKEKILFVKSIESEVAAQKMNWTSS